MAESDMNASVREYLAGIGKRGGEATVPKGFSVLSDEDRKANARKAANARWSKVKAKKKAAKKAK